MAVKQEIELVENGEAIVKEIELTPIKAIRFNCLQCCCGQVKEIRECPITKCALYHYRLGKRPRIENDED